MLQEWNNFTIDGNRIHSVSISDVLRQLQVWIDNRTINHNIVAANVHVVMEAVRNKDVRQALTQADLVTPDGMPLVIVGRLRGQGILHRTDGPGLMAAALEYGLPYGWRHYFYGSTPEVLAALNSKVRMRWPNIQIAGSFSPPFRTLTLQEDEEAVSRINAASPSILWLGLGCPKQELWMFTHKHTIRVPVMIGVGQAFELISGIKKRSPSWMSNVGLEWLYRIATEPKRVWKRYIINNPWFIWLVLKDEVKRKIMKGL